MIFARHYWWKVLAAVLVLYTIIAGFLAPVPARFILHESIRNAYFHVPMWFTMFILFIVSVVYAGKYLSSSDLKHDTLSIEAANTGIVFGILGLLTGMQWAKVTWGAWWVNDAKLNGVAICLLIYFAYFVLRSSIYDIDKRAKVSAIYNIFAFSTLIPLMYILPKLTDTLHPGAGGNPAFNMYDMDGKMRWVFYPACVGWILLGIWLFTLRSRIKKVCIRSTT